VRVDGWVLREKDRRCEGSKRGQRRERERKFFDGNKILERKKSE